MEPRFDRIDGKLDEIIDRLSDQRERIAKLEVRQKGHTSLFALLGSALLSVFAVLFKKLGLG